MGLFFSSVRSINPGLAHRRAQALTSLNVSQENVEKSFVVPEIRQTGIIDTTVSIQENTLFAATNGKRRVSFEALIDYETGKRDADFDVLSKGKYNMKSNATSTYVGVIADFKYLGLSYATSSYKFDSTTLSPDVTLGARAEENKSITYSQINLGSSYKHKEYAVGLFVMYRQSTEDGKRETFDSFGTSTSQVKTVAKHKVPGIGAGIGYTTKKFRAELSFEQFAQDETEVNGSDPGWNMPASSRISGTLEARFGKLALGGRIRSIQGLFSDLDELISTNMLYTVSSEKDTRLETSFNFSYGADKGLTYSAFLSFSEASGEEKTDLMYDDKLYKSESKSQAYGINVGYYF